MRWPWPAGRDARDRELHDEIRAHLALATADRVARGESPQAARDAARREFGNVGHVTEVTRETWGGVRREQLALDLRYAARALRRAPGFTVAVVLTLALGIGANAAIFSVVDAVLLRPSPFPEPDRLVMIWETDRGSGTSHEPASWPDVADFRARSRTLQSVATFMAVDATLGGATEPVRVPALAVTPNLLRLLGVRPLAGRLFDDGEGDTRAATVAVLGETLWRTRFHADPGVIGRTILVDERPLTVVGVAPDDANLGIRQVHQRADYAAQFDGARVDLWLAMRPDPRQYPRQTHPFLTVARLAPGATLAAARREVAGIAADLERQYGANAHRGVNLEAYSNVVFGPVRRALMMLLGAVALVLLVTCANVANLLLARTTRRAPEVAVRVALGAGPARIRRQFLVESLLLVSLGAAAGIGVAYGGLRVLLAFAPADLPRLERVHVDARILLATGAVAALVAVAFGMLPALQLRRLGVHETLAAQAGSGRRVSDGRVGRRLRDVFAVAEVALAVTLVIGAGVLVRSLWRLTHVDPGFQAARVLEARYQLPATRYPLDYARFPDLPAINGFHARFLGAVRALPGVEAAAVAGASPLDPGFTNSFTIVGREAESEHFPEIRMRFMTPGYLTTLGIPLVRGRAFRDGDDAHAPPVVVINQAAARRYFARQDPIGQRLRFWGAARTVVGVIGDEHFRGLAAPVEPAVYAPVAQAPMQSPTLLVRTRGRDPDALVPALRRALHDVDPAIALYNIHPLAAALSDQVAKPRFSTALLALFGGVAILLALVGVHGVLSYAVASRRGEIGVRMALGATRSMVLRAVVADGMRLAAAGVVIGVVAALAGSRLLASFVFGVTTTDPATFVGVPLAVIAAAAAASVMPALRATRVDPMEALRAE